MYVYNAVLLMQHHNHKVCIILWYSNNGSYIFSIFIYKTINDDVIRVGTHFNYRIILKKIDSLRLKDQTTSAEAPKTAIDTVAWLEKKKVPSALKKGHIGKLPKQENLTISYNYRCFYLFQKKWQTVILQWLRAAGSRFRDNWAWFKENRSCTAN